MKKITIAGIGSVLLGDDGVGPYVVCALEARYRFDDRVTLADFGTPGLDLVAELSGVDALILIDSVNDGAEPGTVTLYRRGDILRCTPPAVRMDPHSPALSESLLIGEMAGEAAKETLLIGISGESFEPGTNLTPKVLEAVDKAIDEVLKELDRLQIAYWKRAESREIRPWWTSSPSHSMISV